ncbi:MAG TPA: glycosyltransferase family 4 protein [Sphingobium sp.]
MRILTVSAFFAGHGGGIELVAGNLAQALAERGHDSFWAAADLDPAPALDGVTAAPLRSFDPIEKLAGLPMPLITLAARRELDRQVAAADAVIIHDALYMPSLAAASSARRHAKPWLLIQHIGAIPYSSMALRLMMKAATRLVTRPMLRRAPQLVFISDAIHREFADVARAHPAQVIFNGVDSNLFHPGMAEERATLRNTLHASGFSEILLFVGRFVERKGLAVLEALARRRPQSLFLLAGGGPIVPDGWALDNVRTLGKCSQSQLADLYRVADALLLPSTGEGFPLVIQEALASGLPVICGEDSAAADPGAASYLRSVAINLTQPALTADRFNDAINAARLGPNFEAASYAAANYNWAVGAERIEALLAELGQS